MVTFRLIHPRVLSCVQPALADVVSDAGTEYALQKLTHPGIGCIRAQEAPFPTLTRAGCANGPHKLTGLEVLSPMKSREKRRQRSRKLTKRLIPVSVPSDSGSYKGGWPGESPIALTSTAASADCPDIQMLGHSVVGAQESKSHRARTLIG